MSYTERFTEAHQLLGSIAGFGPAEYNSGYVSVGNQHRTIVELHYVAADDPGDTVDLRLEEAQDAAGTGAQAIAGKAITQLVGTDEGALCIIEVRMEEMTPGFSFINAELTVTGVSAVSVTVKGVVARYVPVPVTLWEEIVD